MAPRSSSLKFCRAWKGMGGRSPRPLPSTRPVRMVLMKSLPDQVPSPSSLSDVRLAVKLTPQGPDQAVMVAEKAPIQGGPAGAADETTLSASGCPESQRLMSGMGPDGPILSGVWQSAQPVDFTRYSPRAAPGEPDCRTAATSRTARIP